MELDKNSLYCNYCKQKAKVKCGNCQSVFYCSLECQKKDWQKHKENCLDINMNEVVEFIKDDNVGLWRGSKEFGDNSLEDSDHLLIQRSMGVNGKGITVIQIGVKEGSRRQGRASKMLTIIENAAKKAGLKFVEIQTIETAEMLKLIHNRKGYTRSNEFEKDLGPNYPGNFIIRF